MKQNNIHLSIMNKRKILFGIVLLAIILTAIFIFLAKDEQNQFESWINQWSRDNNISTWNKITLSNEWFFTQIGWTALIAIITIFVGVNTFSKKWTNQTRKALTITVIIIVSLKLIYDIYLMVTFKLPWVVISGGASPDALNNQIKVAYDGFHLLSNKWIIFLALGIVILASSIIQLFLIGSIKKKADISYSETIKKSEKEIKDKKHYAQKDEHSDLP